MLKYNDIYFKLEHLDYYIKYSSIEKIEEFKIDYTYKNYIPFLTRVIDSKKMEGN